MRSRHAWVALLFVAVACSRPAPAPEATATTSASAPPRAQPGPADAVVEPSLAPLAGEWLVPLGEDLGFVAPPVGSTEPRPVVVAVHGAGDRPDWSCSEWRAIFGPAPFIVCPRGAPMGRAFVWHSADALRAAIARATSALRDAYPGRVLAAPRVYAGFSQGAALGASIVEGAPSDFAYAVFLEGLGDVEAPTFTRAFHARGGKRIVLACSRAGCEAPRLVAKAALGRAGIDARVVYAGPVGHTVDATVIAALRDAVPWLVAGDPAWRAAAPADRDR